MKRNKLVEWKYAIGIALIGFAIFSGILSFFGLQGDAGNETSCWVGLFGLCTIICGVIGLLFLTMKNNSN